MTCINHFYHCKNKNCLNYITFDMSIQIFDKYFRPKYNKNKTIFV